MATGRTSQITSILEKRKPLARKVTEVELNLKTLALALGTGQLNREGVKALSWAIA